MLYSEVVLIEPLLSLKLMCLIGEFIIKVEPC